MGKVEKYKRSNKQNATYTKIYTKKKFEQITINLIVCNCLPIFLCKLTYKRHVFTVYFVSASKGKGFSYLLNNEESETVKLDKHNVRFLQFVSSFATACSMSLICWIQTLKICTHMFTCNQNLHSNVLNHLKFNDMIN